MKTPPLLPETWTAPIHIPELDPAFTPSALWTRAYRESLRNSPGARPAIICLRQPGGNVFHHAITLLPNEPRWAALNLVYIERTLKFLLWSRGSSEVLIAGADPEMVVLSRVYGPEGPRAFDADFMGNRVFLSPFTLRACEESDLPNPTLISTTGSGGLDGCRIGFDLGGSDRKCAALRDGEVLFSEEVPWDPYFQSDPAYHYDGINDSIRRAAAHLPRVDAIGGSAAGIYIDNEPRVGSLFRGVSNADFQDKVRPIFRRIASEWNVPVVVANDGDVTAIAAKSLPGVSGGILGLALGTSLAAGYVGPDGAPRPWLNELAFVPVDHRSKPAEAFRDEWSGDIGVGARFHSQQALLQLPLCDGSDWDTRPLPERLAVLRDAAERKEEWACVRYETLGVYLGHTIAHFADFYDFDSLLVLGRVTSGAGGELLMQMASRVLRDDHPGVFERLRFLVPDEKFKRHGQAIAAASLPLLQRAMDQTM